MDAQRVRSSSDSSSQELSADNVQIQVSINSEKSIKLNVRPSHSISNVLEFLSASITLPAEVHLLQNGNQLSPMTTVSELNITESSVLILDPPTSTPAAAMTASNPAIIDAKSIDSAPSSGTATPTSTATATRTPKKSNKPRCSKQGCKTFAQPIVGDCGFCQKRFCGKHRMLESHNCTGLDDARQADKDRNAAKLEGERTVMLRGL